jgi:hypothetical protein
VAETRDGAATSPKPQVGRLDTLPRCRREVRKLYVAARQGEITTQDATRLAYLVGLVARMLETADLETLAQRVVAMERTRRP